MAGSQDGRFREGELEHERHSARHPAGGAASRGGHGGPGGAGDGQAARCRRLAVLCRVGGGPLERELAAQGSAHVRLTVETANPLTLSTNIGKLGKAIREHKVELVHAQSRAAAWSASYAARRAGIAFVTSFETAYQGGDGGLTRRWNAVMAEGARIIASSEYLADHIAQTYGVEASRLRIVRQGVDLDAFDPERMRGHRMTKLAERWHLGVDRKVVMLPGAIVRRRGHLAMLEAMQRWSATISCCWSAASWSRRMPTPGNSRSGSRSAGWRRGSSSPVAATTGQRPSRSPISSCCRQRARVATSTPRR
jgi:hypothetical protein